MKVTVVYWHYRKVWRRTRDNNEGNCRLLALEKYGEERGITMKVTASTDTIEKNGEERGITMKVTVVYWH